MSASARVTLAFVNPIVAGLKRYGVVPAEFLSRLGADSELRDGVRVERFEKALGEVARRSGTPHLGIELARLLPLGALGTSDYCFSTSATLLEALSRTAPHVGYFSEAARFELHVAGDTARIEIKHLLRPPRILTDFTLALLVRRMRDVLGEWEVRVRVVRFLHTPPKRPAPYEDYFRAPIQFGARCDDIAFPRELLAARLLTADAELSRLLAVHPRALAPDAAGRPLVGQVRDEMAKSFALGAGAPSIDDVAARLHLSSRSLQRRLTEMKTPYSAVLDDVRREHATTLVAQPGMLIAHIAHRLGFRSVTAFFRAFRRWTGTSPRAFRGDPGR